MRTALISDIHGHWGGLEIVLQDIELRQVDRIVCLGDLVEGGEHNDKVVEFIRTNGIATVRGNHDELNECHLGVDNQKWLTQLPELMTEGDVLFTHISPRIPQKKRSIDNNIEAWNIFDDDIHYRLYFIGHIHFPTIFGAKYHLFGETCHYEVDSGEYHFDETDRYIVCFGAVGYPRRGGKFIRYGIFDSCANKVEFMKLEGPLLPFGLNIQPLVIE